MPKNRYYHYDHETCSFIEVKPKRPQAYLRISVVGLAALALAVVFTWGLDKVVETPEEWALQEENEALQEQLARTHQRITTFSQELEKLAVSDQDLYRALLGTNPIPEDIRQVGVGGSDPYEQFSQFSSPTSQLLRETSQRLDQLERQLSLQNTSYRELSELAEEHASWLVQMPAIMPANGNVISGYGMRLHPILKIRRMHKGVDILVRTGSPVFATGDGVVKEAGRGNGYGKYIVLEHKEAGYQTLYAHLSEIPRHIRAGRTVQRGEQIGLSGNTGLSKSPHLHYEVHDLNERTLNPISFFAPSMTPQQYKALLKASENSKISLD